MIGRIKAHNTLNGFRFSIAEFSLFTLLVFPFGLYYLLHHRLALALIALGLVCNFSMMIVFGIGSVMRKAEGGSLNDLLNGRKREESDRRHPGLFMDTLLLVVASLIPFLLLVSVAIERALFNQDRASRRDTRRD